ncbi:Phospholipase/carboxylesterase/thioesterase [Neohortaea acidophila]|uniref:Phospholipase/carboxylesterase/thioesterase n=1 Tax=Neohortaea acidophila TaxID=245834 RepID=A0A6A6Q3H6_9PEZI|nr:Phospholipase/carboxylesterase/thioesterase [Neohortaea acidophila]KAF2486601.1 Phospholipase/carboxylesterase/thioesterase [Neohortaea acidophila]
MEVIQPTAKHTHTIINLHGRDSFASEYSSEFFESESSSGETLQTAFPSIKWVFPSAPQLISRRFETEMSQWFDMWSTENPIEQPTEEQKAQLRESTTMISQLVGEESKIVGFDKSILCGISQGAATALSAFFQMDERLCAFIGFSTWLPTVDRPIEFKRTPIFLAHCQDDEVIDIKYGQALATRLQQVQRSNVEFHEYSDGGHWINEPKGIDDVIAFLRMVTRL